MKKAITIFPLLVLAGSVMSQTEAAKLSRQTKNNDKPSLTMATPMNPDRQAVIWSDDFSVSSNWVINSPAGSGAFKDWVIGTTVPSGTFPISVINSTSKGNNFALFDSDKNCSGNQVANITTRVPINCSANPFVRLEFQQQYRRFIDSTFVIVSKDSINWDKYPVNVNLIDNDYCAANPEVVKIDISATAGGQAKVWIRFQFYSPSSLGSGSGCAYAWMIDDVSISDLSTNDIGIDRTYVDFDYKDGGYYTETPLTQVVPLTFRAAVSNRGSSAQTSTQLNVKISDGTTVYDQTSASISSIPYRANDTLSITTPAYTPPAKKTYTATFKVSQTQTELSADTLNNIMVNTFKVTDTVYARDNGVRTGLTGPNYYTGGEEDGSEIANVFEFPVKAEASSVSVFLDTTTSLGTDIQAKIYEVDVSGNFLEIAASYPYTIASAFQSKWFTLPLPTNTILDAGKTYLASIVTTGVTAGAQKVVIGADTKTKQPIRTTFVFLSTDQKWVYVYELPMIRLNIKPGFVGINETTQSEAGVKLFQNNPNPFNKTSVISYELPKASKVTLDVYDITGKKLMSIDEGNKNAGLHMINIDRKQLAPGVYSYSLRVGEVSVTKRMVIIE